MLGFRSKYADYKVQKEEELVARGVEIVSKIIYQDYDLIISTHTYNLAHEKKLVIYTVEHPIMTYVASDFYYRIEIDPPHYFKIRH